MYRSREENSSRPGGRKPPTETRRSDAPWLSSTPYPVTCEPGSMPRMRVTAIVRGACARSGRGCGSLSPSGHHVRFVDVEIGPDVLDVVVVLEGLDEAEHFSRRVPFSPHSVLRHHLD